ncbi:hypothetical protein TeGR_g3349, partial [Tetraparma gracilis]
MATPFAPPSVASSTAKPSPLPPPSHVPGLLSHSAPARLLLYSSTVLFSVAIWLYLVPPSAMSILSRALSATFPLDLGHVTIPNLSSGVSDAQLWLSFLTIYVPVTALLVAVSFTNVPLLSSILFSLLSLSFRSLSFLLSLPLKFLTLSKYALRVLVPVAVFLLRYPLLRIALSLSCCVSDPTPLSLEVHNFLRYLAGDAVGTSRGLVAHTAGDYHAKELPRNPGKVEGGVKKTEKKGKGGKGEGEGGGFGGIEGMFPFLKLFYLPSRITIMSQFPYVLTTVVGFSMVFYFC